ncbi:MAG: hypothetical protein LUE98_18890 [Tannerellaceae bacterium]|nr:hypothetical protein [Tannerellaceae bacterium]
MIKTNNTDTLFYCEYSSNTFNRVEKIKGPDTKEFPAFMFESLDLKKEVSIKFFVHMLDVDFKAVTDSQKKDFLLCELFLHLFGKNRKMETLLNHLKGLIPYCIFAEVN